MMTEPIRILQVVNIMDRAGLETMLMNHYRHIDRNSVQFDFLTHRPVDGEYDSEIISLGGAVFRAPRLYPQNSFSYRKYMTKFFSEHYYPVVHSHIDSMSFFPLSMAKNAGVPVRIAHSHSDSIDRDLKYPIKCMAKRRLPFVATHYWACSESSGVFLFGENNRGELRIVRNAVDLSRYSFNDTTRNDIRRALGVDNSTVVIGHVGRFSHVKNHDFLIDVFKCLVSQGLKSVLVLVGDGELADNVRKKVSVCGLESSVRFLGVRSDVDKIMQSFDLLIMPSLYEGVPLTLIESQAAGVPILASDRVSPDAFVLSNCIRLSLNDSVETWGARAIELIKRGRTANSLGAMVDAGYEIKESAKNLSDAYRALYEEAVHK